MHLRVAALAATTLALAAVPLAAGAARSTSVDLVAGTVDGHEILGRSVAGVTAALGRPAWREPGTRIYRLGYGSRASFRTMVIFRRRGSALRAVSIVFERGPVVARGLAANVLDLRPAGFARSATAAYPGRLRVARPARCKPGLCTVVLDVVGARRSVTFGRTAARGTFLTLWSR